MNEIKVGDTVRVDFNDARSTLSHKAEVVHVPVATGDGWIFKDLVTWDIHYVSEGCTVTRRIREQ